MHQRFKIVLFLFLTFALMVPVQAATASLEAMTASSDGSAGVLSTPGSAGVLSTPGSADVLSTPGSADVLSTPGSADVLSTPGSDAGEPLTGSTQVRAYSGSCNDLGDHVFGDDVARVFIVHDDPLSWEDDLAMSALVPVAVHWEGTTCYRSPLLTDNLTGDGRNVLVDYRDHLNRMGMRAEVVFVGDVARSTRELVEEWYGPGTLYTTVSLSDDPSVMSARLGLRYWYNERPAPCTQAVVVPVPEMVVASNVPERINYTFTGQWSGNLDVNATNTSWLEARLLWDDPQKDTDYDLDLTDPYAAHNTTYTTTTTNFKENPTDNDHLSGRGEKWVSTSPYYSHQVYGSINVTAGSGYQRTASSVGAGKNPESDYPVWPYLDTRRIRLGPFYEGQRIYLKTSWPHSASVALDTFIYLEPDDNGEDFDKEIMYNPYYYYDRTPEAGSYVMPRDGYINVTIHAWSTSAASSFTLEAWWDTPGAGLTYPISQPATGTDPARVEVLRYPFLNTSLVEGVSNGAVLASLLDCPLLFTDGGPVAEQELIDALDVMGVSDLRIVDPGATMTNTGVWASQGRNVVGYTTDRDVFNTISNLSWQRTGRKKVILAPLGGPWMVPSAYAGAYWGAPVPAPDDASAIAWTNDATIQYWSMVQFGVEYQRTPLHANSVPSRADMDKLSDDFFTWLGGFSSSFDPTLNDPDGDGVPTGGVWDYSRAVDILVVSPVDAIKPTLDRAIVGKANVGRAPYETLASSMAGLSRSALYWELVFTNASDPFFPDAPQPVDRPWDRVGWTFVAYTHDDDLPNDDDLGDETDDDLCEKNDGGAVHSSYRMSEDLPENATTYGYRNVYDTCYSNVTATLDQGVALWLHADHGGYNMVFESGSGVQGFSNRSGNPWREYETGADIGDPDGTGDTMGLVNPPIDYASGQDMYYGTHKLHSTMIYYQDCMFGATRGPLYMMDRGAAVTVGDMYSMAIAPSPVFNDRFTVGVLSGREVGQAYRWALDESADIYSTGDPGPSSEGRTLQTVLNGDPTLTLPAPSLFPFVNWTLDPYSGVYSFHLKIRDECGVPTDPDTLTVSIGGAVMGLMSGGTGLYNFNWSGSPATDLILSLRCTNAGSRERNGSSALWRQHVVRTPVLDVQRPELNYTGRSVQTLNISTAVFIDSASRTPLGNTSIVSAWFRIVDDDDIEIMTGALQVDNGSWGVFLNVSDLPAGRYNVTATFNGRNVLAGSSARSQFSVVHIIWFEPFFPWSNATTGTLTTGGIGIRSSWALQSNLTPDQTISAYWQLFREDGEGGYFTGATGQLQFNWSSEKWWDVKAGIVELSQGQYYFHIVVLPSFCLYKENDSALFDIGDHYHVEGLAITYTGGMVQQLCIYNLTLMDQGGRVISDPAVVPVARYGIHSDLEPDREITGELECNITYGALKVSVAGLRQGNATVWCYLSTVNGQSFNQSLAFVVTHAYVWHGPSVAYRGREQQYINITGLSVTSSLDTLDVVGTGDAEYATYRVLRESPGGNVNTTTHGTLVYEPQYGWCARYVTTHPLPEGTYLVAAELKINGSAGGGEILIAASSPNFTVVHVLEGSSVGSSYDHATERVDVWGLHARSTYTPFSEVNTSNAQNATYSVHRYSSGAVEPNATAPGGKLTFVNGSWEARGIDVRTLDVGSYVIRCDLSANGWEFNATSEPFTMEYSLSISDPVVNMFSASRSRKLLIGNISVNCPAASVAGVDINEATRYDYSLMAPDGSHVYFKGKLDYNLSTGWFVELNIDTFVTGEYRFVASFDTVVSRVYSHTYDFNLTIEQPSKNQSLRDDEAPEVSMLPCYITLGIVVCLVILLIVAGLIVVRARKATGEAGSDRPGLEVFDYDCPECGAVVFSDEHKCAGCGAKLVVPPGPTGHLKGSDDREPDEYPDEYPEAGWDRDDDPEVEGAWDDDPEVEGAWDDDPEFEGAWDDDPEVEGAWDDDPEVEGAWDDDPEFEGAWDDDPEVEGAWDDDPEVEGAWDDGVEDEGAWDDDPEVEGDWEEE